LYYGFDGPPPVVEPILILNGENRISVESAVSTVKINNVCFPSSVSPLYAPLGKSLASVTVVDYSVVDMSDDAIKSSVASELKNWWGEQTDNWEFLKMYRIEYAQPAQNVPYAIKGKGQVVSEGIQCCGDHRGGATLHGAIASGRQAARRILDS
jgi:protoporphyrinogen oxidase